MFTGMAHYLQLWSGVNKDKFIPFEEDFIVLSLKKLPYPLPESCIN
jgi:hypothetical protein